MNAALLSGNFPCKLYNMLEHEVASKDVITWLPQGQAFKVFNVKEFEAHLLPKFFKHSKIASFQRQLNLYGFKRIVKGDDVGAYYHPQFLRGRRDLLREIQRISNYVKGSKSDYEPDLLYTSTVTNSTTTTTVQSTTTTLETVLTSSSSLSSIAEMFVTDATYSDDSKKSNDNQNEKYISVLDFLDDNYVFGDELYEYRNGSVHTTRETKPVKNVNNQAVCNSNSSTNVGTNHLADITKNPYYNKLNVEKYKTFCENVNTKPSKITQNIGFASKVDPRKKGRYDTRETDGEEHARVVDDVFGSCDSFSEFI